MPRGLAYRPQESRLNVTRRVAAAAFAARWGGRTRQFEWILLLRWWQGLEDARPVQRLFPDYPPLARVYNMALDEFISWFALEPAEAAGNAVPGIRWVVETCLSHASRQVAGKQGRRVRDAIGACRGLGRR